MRGGHDRWLPAVRQGCGSGYWTALLRARGVDVLAYDIRPPPGGEEAVGQTGGAAGAAEEVHPASQYDEGESIFAGVHIEDVLQGGVEKPACPLPQCVWPLLDEHAREPRWNNLLRV